MSEQSSVELQKEIDALRSTIVELENTSKMLVRRDLDLREAYEALKNVEREKADFVSTAAHQLRTPLSSIKFALHLLNDTLMKTGSDEQKRLVGQAEQSIARMFEVTEELLAVDLLDYGNYALHKKKLSVEKLITDVLNEQVDAIKEREIVIHRNFDTSGQVLNADEKWFRDAISNLISNAVKYTPTNGDILITTSYKEGKAIITIEDNGIGFTKEEAGRLFRKFYRLENAKRVDANGSGLGLYIAKKVVELHGGVISATPNKTSGAKFCIELPL